MKYRHFLFVLLSLGTFACSEPATNNSTTPNNAQCTGKCDSNSAEELLDQLEDRNDPIAVYLKAHPDVAKRGLVAGDFESLIKGINESMGCESSAIKHYFVSDTLITGDVPFPRNVSVVCSGTRDASKVFFSMPDANEAQTDIDGQTIEMFAWDDDADKLQFYKTFPYDKDDKPMMTVEVGPEECTECHLGASDLMAFDSTDMPMLPIMNELTEPWVHWNAEPGFKSQNFAVSDEIVSDSLYNRMNENVGSASELEQLIRDAQKRVISQRYAARKDDVSLVSAMALLRPLYCAEQINYVSERGDSGLIGMGAFFDQNIRALLSKASYEATSDWYYSSTQTLAFGAREDKQALVMLPERGAADMAFEIKMARVLTPQQLLRIRALDWHNPVYSEFRCNLWKDAHDRLRKDPPAFIEGAESNADAIPEIYAEIMKLDGTTLLGEESFIVVLPSATSDNVETLKTMLKSGDLAVPSCDEDEKACVCSEIACNASLGEFDSLIDEYADAVVKSGRDGIWAKRQENVCIALEKFPNSPFLEDSNHCP